MGKARILLVDDEEIVLVGWKEELKAVGYDVRTATSGKKAIEIAKEEMPDIVVTDLVMPEMNGVEVCRNLREMYPDLEVLFVSGHPIETEKRLIDFIEAGGRDEFLRKPFLKKELIDVIEKIINEKFF